MTPLQVATSIFAIVLVIAGSYYCTRLLAKKTRKGQRGGMIQLLDRFSFAREKSFMLIEVCGKFYLIAESGNAVALIDKLEAETLRAHLREDDSSAFSASQAGARLGAVLSNAADSMKKRIAAQKEDSSAADAEITPSFDMYLQGRINAEQAFPLSAEDRLEQVYDRIQRRKEKAPRDIGSARRAQTSAPEEGPPR